MLGCALRDAAGARRRLLLAALVAGLLALAGAGPASALTVQGPGAAAVEGAAFSGAVASFTDAATLGCPAATSYVAGVVWADGSTSTATVGAPVAGAVLNCTYAVMAAHVFAEEGTEPVAVTVTPAAGGPVTATVPATVTDAPLTAAGASLAATVGTPVTGAVASFTDAGADGVADTAQVTWGDGSAPAAATIAADPSGGFTVTAAHTYDRPGTFAPTVAVADDGGSTASATGMVTVTAAAAPATPPAPAAPAAPATSPGAPMLALSAPRLAGPRTLTLRVACPASAPRCRGVARIVTRVARSAAVRAGTTLGSALFVLFPGQSRTLTIAVPDRLRRALRRRRTARVGGVAISFAAGGHAAAATGPAAVILTAGLAR